MQCRGDAGTVMNFQFIAVGNGTVINCLLELEAGWHERLRRPRGTGVRSHPGRSSDCDVRPPKSVSVALAWPACPATPLARGQSPASHGRLGSVAQVCVSLFDDGGMTGHSAVSVMVMAL